MYFRIYRFPNQLRFIITVHDYTYNPHYLLFISIFALQLIHIYYMPKTGSSSLFELIKSLSQTEKRYFKVFLQKYVKGDKNSYAKLFDSIERQKNYDESKLKSFSHLAVMKVRLEENILWSLQDFHSSKSVSEKLKREIRSIEILFHKRLLEHAKKQIIKSKKTAEHHQEYLSLHELLRWELKIINAQSYANVSEDEVKTIYKQAEECLKKSINANQYSLFCDLIYLQIRKRGFFRKKQELKKFGRIMKHPLLKSVSNTLSIDAKYFFHSAHIGYAQLQGNIHKADKNNNEILKLLENNPQHIQKDPRKYLSMKQNSTVWLYHFKEYEKAIESLEKLKQFIIQQRTSLSEYLFARTFYYVNTAMLYSYCRLGEYDRAIGIATAFKKEFEKYKAAPLNRETEWMFCDAVGTVYFGAGKYSESIRWLNKIIQDKEGNIRSDMQCMTRIFSLIAHYELGNQELLRYMVKWTYRFLAKRQRLYKFETIILEFIGKKSQHIDTRKKTVAAFSELKNDLIKLLPDIHERRPLDDFEYIEWLESKIHNKPFAEVVREKFKKTA